MHERVKQVHNEFQSILNNDIRYIESTIYLYTRINLGTYTELIRPVMNNLCEATSQKPIKNVIMIKQKQTSKQNR